MTKIKSSKKFVALFILAVFTLTAFLLVGCGDDKSVNINTSSKNYQTMTTSDFVAEIGTYQSADSFDFDKYEFEMEVSGTIQSGEDTSEKRSVHAYGQMDMVNQIMSMEVKMNGEKSYSYISDGYLYLNQNGEKIKFLMEQAGGQMSVVVPTMETINSFVSSLEMNATIENLTIVCESAVDGDFTKYHVSLIMENEENTTQTMQSDIYIIMQGENLYAAQYITKNGDNTQTATMKVYDGEIDLPSFDDYVEPTTNLF